VLSFALLAVAIVLLAAFERRPRSYVGARDEWRAAANQVLQERAIKRRINMDWGRSEVKVLAGGGVSIRPKLRYRILPNIRKLLWPSKAQAVVANGKARWATLSPRGQRIIRWTVALAAMVIIGILSWRYLGVPLSMPLGVTNTWTGVTDTVYSTDTNWDQGHKPTATEDINMGVSAVNCTMDEDSASLGTLTIPATYTGTLDINTWTLTYTTGSVSGLVTVSTGSLVGSLTTTVTAASITYSGAGALTISLKLVITGGTVSCSSATVTIGGTLTNGAGGIQVGGGIFVGGSGTHNVSGFYLASGTATWTSGTMTCLGAMPIGGWVCGTNSGTLNHGSGTLVIATTLNGANLSSTTTNPWYHLIINSPGVNLNISGGPDDIVVAGDFTFTAGTLDSENVGSTFVVTGTSSITGTFNVGTIVVTLTGNVTINSGGTIGKTSGTGTFTFGGGNVTVASGGLLSFTGAGQVVSCTIAVGISISAGGSLVVNGSVGSRITFSTYEYLNMSGTIDAQYADFTSGASGEYAINISGTPTITRIDNCTFTQNHASGAAALLQQSTTVIVTCTNCTFSSTEGAAYQRQDIGCNTNARLQLSSCTYTTVGLQATSGWVNSIADQGVANAHVIYGILSASAPDASYEIADADNVTIKNANVYSVSFNSVLTLDQAETVASLTTSASTTAKLNGGITLTFTTITNDGAFEFAANTVNAAVLSGGTIGGTAPDMDSGGAGSKVTLTGVTITPALTTGGTGVTITYTGTCVQTGAMVVSTGDKVTTATATITYSSTFACTGEIESTGASAITYQDTYTANAGTEDYQAGTVTLDLGTNAYTVTSGVRKFFNLVFTGTNALTLGANNIGCVGISFDASGYTGTVGSGASNYRFDLYLTGATQTCTLGAQTWNNATSGQFTLVYVIGTGSSTTTIDYGSAVLGVNKVLLLDCGGLNQTVNISGTLTGSGASSYVQYTSEAKTGCVYNHNASVVTGFGAFNFDGGGSTVATTLNITTGTISVTTINVYDLKVVNVTDAATISCTTWTVGEIAGNGATVTFSAAPATLTVATYTHNALSTTTFAATMTFAPSVLLDNKATATLAIDAGKTVTIPYTTGFSFVNAGTITNNGTVMLQAVIPAAVALDATSGLGETNADLVQIATTTDFLAGDNVHVWDTSDAAHLAGEDGTVDSVQAGDYLDLVADLAKAYTVAAAGKVIRKESRPARINSSTTQAGTIGGTGTFAGQASPKGEIWASTLATDAILAFVDCDVFVAAAAGGTTYEVREGYLNKWLHPLINRDLN